jgi:hypothetical protein
VLILTIFFLACAFCASALFLNFGFKIFNEKTCRASVILCLTFYLGQKYALYLFLVERAHIVRAISRTRSADPIYIAGIAFVLVGFTVIGVSSLFYHVANYGSVCHIGIRQPVTAAFLAWDVFMNLFLTFVFLYYLREFLEEGVTMTVAPIQLRRFLRPCRRAEASQSSSRMVFVPQESIIHVIRKTLWSCIGILLLTVTNLTLLLVNSRGQEAWLCFTICTLDGTFNRLTGALPHNQHLGTAND